jgi:sugar phosphate isomerase/epimerase
VKLGLYTDSVSALTFDEALDLAVRIGATDLEIATGGMSAAPHLPMTTLLADKTARREWHDSIESRGLRLAALNCSAWPLHPTKGPADRQVMRDTLRLAGLLGVPTVVTMSGNPGDGADATTFNWMVASTWPPDALALRERQWVETFVFWHELVAIAHAEAIERIALELHPFQMAYNVATLRRLRDEVGPIVGANVDPSHLFWQQMDPLAVIRELGNSVHHVHLKDTQIVAEHVGLNGVLDQTGDPTERAWNFVTVGRGHAAAYWSSFLEALRDIGYTGSLSIENEDPFLPAVEGVVQAAAFMLPLIEASQSTRG